MASGVASTEVLLTANDFDTRVVTRGVASRLLNGGNDVKMDMESSMNRYEDICKQKKSDDEAKAKLEATEVPKATMHDARLEAMVKKAYEDDHHGVNKVLKVVLEGRDDE